MVKDPILFPIVPLIQFPSLLIHTGEQLCTDGHLIFRMRPANDLPKRTMPGSDQQLPAIPAAYVQQRITRISLKKIDSVLELAPLRLLERVELICFTSPNPRVSSDRSSECGLSKMPQEYAM